MINNNSLSPLVSVFMMTYNHKNYINNAIEGILLQRTNFPIEVVIRDDFSTGGTRDILIKYKNEYPDIVKLILYDRNIGVMNNQIITLQNCVSTNYAICESDDYWIDEYKPQN